jgi:hypothetical protein
LSDLIKTENKIELSNDINVITAEIKSYKEMAGYAVFEIGKRLKYVKKNSIIFGFDDKSFVKWCENNLDMTWQTAYKFIQIFEQFGSFATSRKLPTGKLFEMLALPESINKEEFIQKPHIIPSTGEQKTVEDMTVKELREVKRTLKEVQDKNKKLETELEQEKNKEPTIQEKEVIPEDIKIKLKKLEEDLKKKNTELQNTNITKQAKEKLDKEIKQLKEDKKKVEDEKSELEKQLNSEEFELIKLTKEQEILEKENQISYLQAQLETKKYVEKITPLIVLQSQRISKAFTFKNDWLEMAEMLEDLGRLIREQIQCSRKILNVEYSYNEEEDNNGKLAV